MTYERRYADVGWAHGSLARRPNVEQAPGDDIPVEDRRSVLDAADEIVAAVAPELVEERLKELGQLDSSTKRRWMFWRR